MIYTDWSGREQQSGDWDDNESLQDAMSDELLALDDEAFAVDES